MQRHVRRAEDVAGHVAERARAEVIEAAPREGLIKVRTPAIGLGASAHGEWTLLGHAEPQVPIERRRHRLFLRDFGDALRPQRAVAPCMDFRHVADLAVPNDLGALASAFVRVALVAHLRRHFVLGGRFAHLARFPNRAHEGFLHVDVLAPLHAPHGRRGVHVIRRRDNHGVDVLGFLVEHLAEVAIGGGVRERLERLGGAPVVHVAQRDDVLGRRRRPDIARSLAARTDRGEVQLLVGGLVSSGLQRCRRAERGGRRAGQQAAVKKVTSR